MITDDCYYYCHFLPYFFNIRMKKLCCFYIIQTVYIEHLTEETDLTVIKFIN